jgi:hypothetical protein
LTTPVVVCGNIVEEALVIGFAVVVSFNAIHKKYVRQGRWKKGKRELFREIVERRQSRPFCKLSTKIVGHQNKPYGKFDVYQTLRLSV